MEEQLSLTLEPPPPDGLTGWRQGQPPFIGWWDTRQSAGPTSRTPLVMRRWWGVSGWSSPVLGDDEAASDRAREGLGSVAWPVIEWRGLATPPANGYAWALDVHHRSNLATAARARTPLTA